MAGTQRWIWVPSFCFLLMSCGEENTIDPSTIFDGNGTNKSGTFCVEYCNTLVQEAPGCEHYNDNERCEQICGFYLGSVCKTPYEAFATCMQETESGECFLPDAGKLTLVVNACHEQYEAWIQCREEKNAGICPY